MDVLIFALMGLVIGSFLNVCIYRIPRNQSIVWPGSHCPECGYILKWYDLIPVFGYLFLRGKCRQCREHISYRYPVVEIVTALLFVATYLKFGNEWSTIGRLIFISSLVVIALIDVEHLIIPNVIVLPVALLGLSLAFLPGDPTWISSISSGLGAALVFLIILLIYPAGMGEGDVKMVLMMGTFLGWPQIGVAIFLASLIGTFGGLAIIFFKGGNRKTPVPFGLYLALGSVVALFFGNELIVAYLRFIGM